MMRGFCVFSLFGDQTEEAQALEIVAERFWCAAAESRIGIGTPFLFAYTQIGFVEDP
jgi:hypothetical protein